MRLIPGVLMFVAALSVGAAPARANPQRISHLTSFFTRMFPLAAAGFASLKGPEDTANGYTWDATGSIDSTLFRSCGITSWVPDALACELTPSQTGNLASLEVDVAAALPGFAKGKPAYLQVAAWYEKSTGRYVEIGRRNSSPLELTIGVEGDEEF